MMCKVNVPPYMAVNKHRMHKLASYVAADIS